jgi:hypothetical protein
MDLEIFAYVLETEYEAFLAVQEDLLLRIMDLVESSGSGFAFPSQTVYMKKDGGLDAEKGRAAADAVGRWRDQGELPFPDHRSARVSQLDGTLEYPPKGSVLSEKKDRVTGGRRKRRKPQEPGLGTTFGHRPNRPILRREDRRPDRPDGPDRQKKIRPTPRDPATHRAPGDDRAGLPARFLRPGRERAGGSEDGPCC